VTWTRISVLTPLLCSRITMLKSKLFDGVVIPEKDLELVELLICEIDVL